MELTREGMGRSPPPREGEEAETINTFAPVIQNPGVFTRGGHEAPLPLRGPQAPARPAQLGDPHGCRAGTVTLPCAGATR